MHERREGEGRGRFFCAFLVILYSIHFPSLQFSAFAVICIVFIVTVTFYEVTNLYCSV